MALKDSVKKLLGIGVPGGVDDIVIRAIKTGVQVFLATPFVVALLSDGKFDVNAAQAAALAAGAAVVSVLLNALQMALASWSSK